MNINKLTPSLKKIVSIVCSTGKFDISTIKQSSKLKIIDDFDPSSRTNKIKPKLVKDNSTNELLLFISHNGGNKINTWRFSNGGFVKFSPVAKEGRFSFIDIDIGEDPISVGSMIYFENSKVTPLPVCLEIAKKLLSKYPVTNVPSNQSSVIQTPAKPYIPILKLDEIFIKPTIIPNPCKQQIQVLNFKTIIQKQEIERVAAVEQVQEGVIGHHIALDQNITDQNDTESYLDRQFQQVVNQNVQVPHEQPQLLQQLLQIPPINPFPSNVQRPRNIFEKIRFDAQQYDLIDARQYDIMDAQQYEMDAQQYEMDAQQYEMDAQHAVPDENEENI